MLLAAALGLSDIVVGLFVGGLFVGWVLVMVLLLLDMIRDPTLGGWAKVGWVVLLVVLPMIGIFTYLLVRGDVVGRRVGASLASDVHEPLGPRPEDS